MTHSPTSRVREAIWASLQMHTDAFKRGDAAGLAALYTRDGQILAPNGGFTKGQRAIQAHYQALMDRGMKGATAEILEVEDLGDTAIEVSEYTDWGQGDHVVDRGKYIAIWKKEDGLWKIHRDIYNTSNPAPA